MIPTILGDAVDPWTCVEDWPDTYTYPKPSREYQEEPTPRSTMTDEEAKARLAKLGDDLARRGYPT